MVSVIRRSVSARRVRGALVGGVVVCAALLCGAGGCAGRFTAKTDYLAPGFTRASLRGRTVAVLPVPSSAAADRDDAPHEAELAGVTRGVRDAGVRVHVVPPAGGEPDDPPARGPAKQRDGAVLLADFPRPHGAAPRVLGEAVGHAARAAPGAAYLLLVRFTDADVYRAYATRRGGAAAVRTTGRRVGLRLALVRVPDGATLWLAGGSGQTWATRTTAAAAAAGPAGGEATAFGVPAGDLDGDLRAGNAHLYPPPPGARALARTLTRRLLADVPYPRELEPN